MVMAYGTVATEAVGGGQIWNPSRDRGNRMYAWITQREGERGGVKKASKAFGASRENSWSGKDTHPVLSGVGGGSPECAEGRCAHRATGKSDVQEEISAGNRQWDSQHPHGLECHFLEGGG